jgi:ABC-2 type transport system permease protein
MFAVYKKELKVYFTSPLGYTLLSFYLFFAGLMFCLYFLGVQNTSDFAPFFAVMNTLFLFLMPLLTLRILAEDKKLGVYELLLTSPVSVWEIIGGKFLGVLTFSSVGALILLVYPFVLGFYVSVEWGAILSGFLGLIFSLAFFISIGIFASSLTENYVIVGLVSFALFLIFFITAFFADTVEWLKFLKDVSYSGHYYQFAVGLIRLKDVLYFVMGTFFWLYLAKNIVESRSWK